MRQKARFASARPHAVTDPNGQYQFILPSLDFVNGTNWTVHIADANFAARWFEVDPCYQVMRVLHVAGIIDLDGVPAARLPAEA